jgi:hypothetical protein
MLVATQLTSRITLYLSAALLVMGCTTTVMPERKFRGPASKAIAASYEETWRAIQKALMNYPIRINNIDAGVIETEVLRGQELWRAPHLEEKYQPGIRYSIKVTAIKGESERGQSTMVSVQKILRHEKNFFSDAEQEPSDGFEEEMLIYRIERELTIERAIEKGFKEGRL